MKNFLTILFFFNFATLNAQNVEGREIDSIVVIDSLFYYDYPFKYEWIKKDKNKLIFEHLVTIYDSTRQFQNSFRVEVDTISLDCLNDSTLLVRLLDKYNLNNNEAFRAFKRLILLIRENEITCIEPSGPGDCARCSRYIFINNTTAFLIMDRNNHCYPEHCFWRPREAKQRKIKKDIYIINNIGKYH